MHYYVPQNKPSSWRRFRPSNESGYPRTSGSCFLMLGNYYKSPIAWRTFISESSSYAISSFGLSLVSSSSLLLRFLQPLTQHRISVAIIHFFTCHLPIIPVRRGTKSFPDAVDSSNNIDRYNEGLFHPWDHKIIMGLQNQMFLGMHVFGSAQQF